LVLGIAVAVLFERAGVEVVDQPRKVDQPPVDALDVVLEARREVMEVGTPSRALIGLGVAESGPTDAEVRGLRGGKVCRHPCDTHGVINRGRLVVVPDLVTEVVQQVPY